METMSICKFMLVYYGVALTSGPKYSHELLKKEFKLKTCPFTYVFKNEEEVAEGRIIFVKDSYNNVEAYPAPELDKLQTSTCECSYMEPEDNEVTDEEIEQVKELLKYLSELPPNKLRDILQRYKGIDSICRHVIRELRRRGSYSIKKYKKKRLLDQVKGMENPDKYEKRIEIVYKKMK